MVHTIDGFIKIWITVFSVVDVVHTLVGFIEIWIIFFSEDNVI